MIISVVLIVILAVVILAYVLEPILRARVDRIELDTAIQTPPVPDFRKLLEPEDDETPAAPSDAIENTHQPEPAEHHS